MNLIEVFDFLGGYEALTRTCTFTKLTCRAAFLPLGVPMSQSEYHCGKWNQQRQV